MNTTSRILFPACLAAGLLLALLARPALANQAAERLLDRGMELFEQEDAEQAAFFLEQALIADPADAQVRFWLGRSYWQQEQMAKARRAFDQAIAIDPAHENALYWGGLADLQLDDRDAAEEKFTWLERLCGDCDKALELRAELDKPEDEPFLDLFSQNDSEAEADENNAGDEPSDDSGSAQ